MINRGCTSVSRLDGTLDITDFLGWLISGDLGSHRRCWWRVASDCLLSNFGGRFMVYMPPPNGVWLRLCAVPREFAIPDILNLGLKGL